MLVQDKWMTFVVVKCLQDLTLSRCLIRECYAMLVVVVEGSSNKTCVGD